MISDSVIRLIESVQLSYATEVGLQEQLHGLFLSARFDFTRECRLSPRDRVDFLVNTASGNIAVECKTAGAIATITRQLSRYAESSDVHEIVLVTSKRKHIAGEAFREQSILGKPLRGIWIGGFQ